MKQTTADAITRDLQNLSQSVYNGDPSPPLIHTPPPTSIPPTRFQPEDKFYDTAVRIRAIEVEQNALIARLNSLIRERRALESTLPTDYQITEPRIIMADAVDKCHKCGRLTKFRHGPFRGQVPDMRVICVNNGVVECREEIEARERLLRSPKPKKSKIARDYVPDALAALFLANDDDLSLDDLTGDDDGRESLEIIPPQR